MSPLKRSADAAGSNGGGGAAHGQNWKKRKQERARDARFIETQASIPTSSGGINRLGSASGSGSNTVSTSTSRFATPTGAADGSTLPTSIEVESLVSSRAFQIQSFLRSIKLAKSATTTRAWQLLPRHARRRAASHNLLRLPSRLRGKALAELKSSTTQARTRSESRKRMPDHGIVRATLRRQKLAIRASHPNRRWLETHMWHAKRFRMSAEKGKGKEKDQGVEHGRWGFVLPETTMMKSHKASWRSALEFATIHDASYYSVFRIGARKVAPTLDAAEMEDAGLQSELLKALRRGNFGPDSLFDGSSTTSLVTDTILHGDQVSADEGDSNGDLQGESMSDQSSIRAALAPVRIILLPQLQKFRHKTLGDTVSQYACREALIFVHPAGQIYVRRALKQAGFGLTDERKNVLMNLEPLSDASAQLYAFQLRSAPDPWLAAGGKDSTISKLEKRRRRQAFEAGTVKKDGHLERKTKAEEESFLELDEILQSRRQQGYNIFELVGPRASALLQSVLKLDEQSTSQSSRSAFQNLISANRTEGISPAMVAVNVNDPRLSYPPKLKANTTADATPLPVSNGEVSENATSQLLTLGASRPRFSKGEIDSRRARNVLPGARLKHDPRDDIVPVVLVKKILVTKPNVQSFTLLVPRGWGMAFFLSLVTTHQSGASCGARVLGQHQLRHQKLELAALAGAHSTQTGDSSEVAILSYPHDWPGTLAYAATEKEAAKSRHETWSKRPRGKRVEYKLPTQREWKAFTDRKTSDKRQIMLDQDRVGSARPFPFGGPGIWEWIFQNSERVSGNSLIELGMGPAIRPRLLALSTTDALSISQAEKNLAASSLACSMVPLKLHAVRKGTIAPQSSLMLPSSFEDQLSWIQHLDPSKHPALVLNRTSSSKTDKAYLKDLVERRLEIMQLGHGAPALALQKQSAKRKSFSHSDVWSEFLASAPDPQALHTRSADWNNTIGLVLDGDYSLRNGRGFGVGAVTLRSWMQVLERQSQLDASVNKAPGGRKPRNSINTNHLLLMRQPGTDVVRALTATLISL